MPDNPNDTVTIQKIRDVVTEVVAGATDDMRQDLQTIKATLGDHTKTLDGHTKNLADHTKVLKDHSQSLDLIRQVQGSQSIMLHALTTDVGQIKQTVRRQGVFYEDLESRFTTLAENVSSNLTIRRQVQTHETRLTDLELLRPVKI